MTNRDIEDLVRRVEQLERALLAVSLKQPVALDQDGRLSSIGNGSLANVTRNAPMSFFVSRQDTTNTAGNS